MCAGWQKGDPFPGIPVVLAELVTFLLSVGNEVSGTCYVDQPYFTPFGYTRILLASPVFNRSMATAKSFIGRRSVITGRRSSRPLVSSAVIWYHVWYIRRPLMP